MALILQVVAAMLTVLGAATLYWGTTPSLLSLGNTVMVVGAVIAASGIVLFGLAAVLGQLGILANKLDDLRWALDGAAAAPAPVRQPAIAEDTSEPSPLWREGLPEHPAAAAPAPAAPEVAPSARVDRAPAVPPSRESFGLPPVAATAALGAVAAGTAATLATARPAAAEAAPALAREAEKPEVAEIAEIPAVDVPAIEPVLVEPVLVEALPVEPIILEPSATSAEKDEDKDDADAPALELHAAADAGTLHDFAGDAASETPHSHDSRDQEAEETLSHAVEELKEEVKAAEADLAENTGPGRAAGDDGEDHMASLEKLLLGDAPAKARMPAEVDTDDFMARLRETISKPIVAPAPEPEEVADLPAGDPAVAEDEPLAADETAPSGEIKDVSPARAPDIFPPPILAPAPVAPAAAPPFSIEDELERALKASLDDKPIASAPPVREPPPFLSRPAPTVTPVPDPRPAPEISVDRGAPANRDAAMAALARDFPELDDLLAPKKPAADPAGSLIDDLKGIFEPAASPAPARQEPAFVPPPPAPPAPSPAPMLREGVIAGIPFRLYGDGTIEADLEAGTTRFASLKDFRAHVGG